MWGFDAAPFNFVAVYVAGQINAVLVVGDRDIATDPSREMNAYRAMATSGNR